MMNLSSLKYILLGIILVFFSIGSVRTSLSTINSKSGVKDLDKELEMLEKDQADLQNELELKKSDYYVEQKARDALSLIKPGEEVFVLDASVEQIKPKKALSLEDQPVIDLFRNKMDERVPNESALGLWLSLFFGNMR